MKRLPVVLTGVVALLACLLVILFEPEFLVSISRQGFDVFLRASAKAPQSDAVVLLDIDEESLNRYGQWPWPRRLLGRMVDELWKDGAAVVVFDIVFPEPDRSSPCVIAREWETMYDNRIDIRGIPSIYRDYDWNFSQALGGGRSLLGCYMEQCGEEAREVVPDPLYEGHFYETGPSQPRLFYQANAVISSLPILRKAAASEAFFNNAGDEDNIVRRTPLFFACGPLRIYPALSLEAVRLYLDLPNYGIEWDDEVGQGVRAVRLRDRIIPTDANGALVLNFRASPFPRISAIQVLNGTVSPVVLSNRIVFIGTSAAGLRDLKATPIRPEVPGIEVHATAADNILAGDMLRHPRWMIHAHFLAVLLGGLLLIPVLSRTRALVGFIVMLGLIGLALWIGWWLLTRHLLVVSPGRIVISIAAIYLPMTVVKFWMEERERRRVRAMFEPMVSNEVLSYMEDHPDSFSLTGRKVDATAFFSDITNFTTSAERLDPDELSRLMNRYLTPMSNIIMARNGYVDKFYGDAIMAVWGVPYPLEDHAVQGCLAALEQIDRLKSLQNELSGMFSDRIKIRIGINTGEVTAGNMGSDRRFQYTVMGDAVNLASRLQQVNKVYGTTVIIGPETYARAREYVEVRKLGLVRVRGKTEAVEIFELLARRGKLDDERYGLVRIYESALEQFLARNWNECLDQLAGVLEQDPTDGPSRFLAEQAHRFQVQPPPKIDNEGFSLELG